MVPTTIPTAVPTKASTAVLPAFTGGAVAAVSAHNPLLALVGGLVAVVALA
jgi:hypothetical protein